MKDWEEPKVGWCKNEATLQRRTKVKKFNTINYLGSKIKIIWVYL